MGERRNNCNQIHGVDTSVKKWLIVVVAGQSNAVGYDESAPVESEYPENPRICQLGYYGDDNLKIVPLRWCAQNFQDMRAFGLGKKGAKGIHYPLGQELLKWIPSDYGVLFIPAAFGGTMTTYRGNAVYNAARANFNAATMQVSGAAQSIPAFNWMCLKVTASDAIEGTNPIRSIHKRLKHVLTTYPESALLAIVWVQGESSRIDAASGNKDIEAVLYGYTAMFASIKEALARTGIKNIVGKPVDYADIFTYLAPAYWSSASNPNAALYKQIQELYKTVLPANNYVVPPQTDSVTNKYNGAPMGPIVNGTQKAGPGQTSTNQVSHYGNNAFKEYIAPMLSEAIKKHYDSLNARYFTIKNQHELITSMELN